MFRWFTRNVTKPIAKKFRKAPLFPSVENCCNCGITIPVVLVVVFLVMLLSIDTIRYNNTVVFSIGSPGKDPIYLNGIYKMAYERDDGSIDVVFNIPKGADALLKANISSAGIDPEVFNISGGHAPKVKTNTTTVKPVEFVRQNLYPLTVDADYVINPANLCPAGKTLDYIIIVHSATAYFQRRKTIRETFAAKKLFGTVDHRVLFLLGQTNDPKTTRAINLEALTYGDVLQGPFADSYHNLTHKGVMGFRWLTEYCPNVRLVVKIDDDVFMNPFQFVSDYLPLYANKTRIIACDVRPAGTSEIQRGKGKWQVKSEEFQGHRHFPFSYCHGFFVILTPDLLRPLLLAVKMNPFFWIDDVYLFGMLPATIGDVSFINIRSNLTLSSRPAKECYANKGPNCNILASAQWKEGQTTLWRMTLNLLVRTEMQRLQLFQLPKH